MKRFLLAISATLFALQITAAQAQSFTPLITQTVGTGANTSYFVVNFDDGPNGLNNPASDYVFAFRWNYNANNTAPTGEDMLVALDQSTAPRLQINQTYFSFGDYSVDSISYLSSSQTGNYAKNQSYWQYWESTGMRLSQDTTDWDFAKTGPLGRTLAPNSYDGRTFSILGSNPIPVTPQVQATPEPASVGVLALGAAGVVFLAVRRRRADAPLS